MPFKIKTTDEGDFQVVDAKTGKAKGAVFTTRRAAVQHMRKLNLKVEAHVADDPDDEEEGDKE